MQVALNIGLQRVYIIPHQLAQFYVLGTIGDLTPVAKGIDRDVELLGKLLLGQ
jgi:hypothetical protein